MNEKNITNKYYFVLNTSITLTIAFSVILAFLFYEVVLLFNYAFSFESKFFLFVAKTVGILSFFVFLFVINDNIFKMLISMNRYKINDIEFKLLIEKLNIDEKLVENFLKTSNIKDVISTKNIDLNNIHTKLDGYKFKKINNENFLIPELRVDNVIKLIKANKIIKFLEAHNKNLSNAFD